MAEQLPAKKGGCAKYLAIGCLVLLVLGCIGVYIAVKNAKRMATEIFRVAIVKTVEEANLPDAQEKALIEQVNQLAERIKTGEVSLEQFGEIAKQFAEGPMMPAIVLTVSGAEVIDTAGLSDADKKTAARSAERFVRGAVEGKISRADCQKAMGYVVKKEEKGQQTKKPITKDEARALLVFMKEKADAAAVPDEAYTVDYAGEFKKMIDGVLKK
jgi:hypothetical protein